MNPLVQGAAAVVGGFLGMMVVVMMGTAAATAAFVPGGLATMKTGPTGPLPRSYLASNLLVSLLAAVLGGWLTVTLGPLSGIRLALFLAGIVLLMAARTAHQSPTSNSQPYWYPRVIALVGVVGVIAGGWIRTI